MIKNKKKNPNKIVDLYVIYQLKEYSQETESIIFNIASKYNVQVCNSGAGFGVRDIHFRGKRSDLHNLLTSMHKILLTLEGEVE